MIKFQLFYTSVLLCGLTVLNGCSSDGGERADYLDARSAESLEIPPKLTSPDNRGALQLPKPSDEALQKFANLDAVTETPVAVKFEGARLRQRAGLNYLEVDQSVDEVWKALPSFLAAEGIELDRVEKLMGFVDTTWMNEYQVSNGSEKTSSWFSGFSPDYKDKFRIRLEPDENRTKLFVAHRGMQIVVKDDVTAWQQRPSEAELEREILYRFLLHIGAQKQQAVDLLSAYRSYQSRAHGDDQQQDQLTVMGEEQQVWMRLRQAIDRLGVDLLSVKAEQLTMQVKVGNIKQKKPQEKQDEGWFSSLFGSKDIEVDFNEDYDDFEYKKVKVKKGDEVTLTIRQIASPLSSVIRITQADGSDLRLGLGFELRDALIEQLQ